MRQKRSPAVVIALLLAACAGASAQEVARLAEPEGAPGSHQRGVYGKERAANEYGFWGGGSFSSPTVIGKTEGTRFGLVPFRYARVLARVENLAL